MQKVHHDVKQYDKNYVKLSKSMTSKSSSRRQKVCHNIKEKYVITSKTHHHVTN